MTTELLLVVAILTVGLVTGWVKLRDQGLSEIKDSIGSIDAFLLGAQTTLNSGGTRWLKAGAIIEPAVAGAVSERWDDGAGNTKSFNTVIETTPGTYESKPGVLVYGPDNANEGW